MRILIIDFYYSTSNVGGLRWKKFCKYLPGEGIDPIILTSGDPANDDDNVFHVPFAFNLSVSHGFAVGRDRSFWGGIKRFIRGNMFIPDPRRLWFCAGRASALIRRFDIPVVITTGPPHSVHLIGLKLKKQHNIKWIADFRDPWLSYWYKDMYLTSIARNRQINLFSKVVFGADRMIAVEEKMFNGLALNWDDLVTVVSNGFDPDDFQGKITPGNEFVYTGSLSDKKLLPDIKYKHVFGRSHAEAIYEMRRAGYLLVAYPDDVIPSKVYEYLASGRPILSFGIKGKGAELIERCQAGVHFTSARKDGIELTTLLRKFISLWDEGVRRNELEIQKYDVKNITKQLAEIICNVNAV